MIFVYKTTNVVNGKFYIGVHEGELNDSYLGSGVLIKAAIKKYGSENFKREILHLCDSRKEAHDLERSIVGIDLVKSANCYNVAIGGEGPLNYVMTDEQRLKLQESKKKFRLENPERWKEICEAQSKRALGLKETNLGRKHSDETRRKVSLSQKGIPNSAETNEKISKALKGKEKSEEHKLNLSRSAMGRKDSEETRKKKSESHKLAIAEGKTNPARNFPGKNMRKIECPHCEKIGAANLMKRYHMDNCKEKQNGDTSFN